MIIEELCEVTQAVYEAFQRLIPQLTPYSPPPSREVLSALAMSPATFVFIAKQPDSDGEIVGCASLGTFSVPTGIHGWIEDVVVDRDARGKGIGRALTEACLKKARELGIEEVNLTSNPTRKAANHLYQSMGFIRVETNLYRYLLD